ncbi:hypothetical protein TIFTF001_031117 [Ficus carica]|uniref:Uncharacterized protein n=1 Tax=Ficus carica TaxID=3494 RepID=A0AA88DUV8_FICCA|nr:hypothetical protein TIFTF001_031117 [Ficus carica]
MYSLYECNAVVSYELVSFHNGHDTSSSTLGSTVMKNIPYQLCWDHYFFMHVNEKSMGGLANAFYLLWGTLRVEEATSEALLFEEKLERLLAQPNREWDEINVPKRFRASSLWKDFVELLSGIAKRVPSANGFGREKAIGEEKSSKTRTRDKKKGAREMVEEK